MPPFPASPPVDFIHWARGEGRSSDLRRKARWICLVGVRPTVAGTSRSSALPVARDLNVSEDAQYVVAGKGTGSKNKLIEHDPGGCRKRGGTGYTGCLDGVRPGGRFWALEQIEEEDEDISVGDEISPNP